MSKNPRPEAYTLIQAGVGERIQWVRELLIPNRAECAKLIDVDKSTLAKIENGTRAPSIFNVIELANRFRCTTDFLLRGQLVSRMDDELALALAARHPELVLKPAGTGSGKDTAPRADIRQAPKIRAEAD